MTQFKGFDSNGKYSLGKDDANEEEKKQIEGETNQFYNELQEKFEEDKEDS